MRMNETDPLPIAPNLTFNANQGTFPRKSIYQILGCLWGVVTATIQAYPDVRFLVRSWAKISQVLTTDGASETVV